MLPVRGLWNPPRDRWDDPCVQARGAALLPGAGPAEGERSGLADVSAARRHRRRLLRRCRPSPAARGCSSWWDCRARSRSRSALPGTGPGPCCRGCCSSSPRCCSLPATSSTTPYDLSFPVFRRRVVHRLLPVTGRRSRPPDPEPNPGQGLGQPARRPDHHGRLRPALLGLPDRAIHPPRRRESAVALGLDGLPGHGRAAPGGGRPAGHRERRPPAGVLPPGSEHSLPHPHRCRLRRHRAGRQLQHGQLARRRLDGHLPPVGRRGAASLDARTVGAGARHSAPR